MWTIQSRTNSKTVGGSQMPGLGETVGLPLKRNTSNPVFTLEEREELYALHWVDNRFLAQKQLKQKGVRHHALAGHDQNTRIRPCPADSQLNTPRLSCTLRIGQAGGQKRQNHNMSGEANVCSSDPSQPDWPGKRQSLLPFPAYGVRVGTRTVGR